MFSPPSGPHGGPNNQIIYSLSFSDIEVCSISVSFCKLSMIVWFGVGVLAAFSVVFVFCVIPVCVIGKEGAIQSISYHSSQKGDTDNNKTDRPTPHFRAEHILSRPQQVEKQTTQPSSQSIKTPTVNRDRVLSPNRVTRPKQPMLSSMIYSWITAFWGKWLLFPTW
jgi:hypothetical protein